MNWENLKINKGVFLLSKMLITIRIMEHIRS